ncbi:hypothetical protein MPNT_20044 [Candidatus Methylacidithermus pantelleriae]|uniref:Uncharacterized protein n=1 Tax=Candidatus Methylacidithermus pantelleriae TaxID=2744239 RepID=A0A8J2BHS9_9BACT|nr:hypothetical protein MPNT_20044 [Candidatus Methylacidithermus pantelleriae]
MAPELGNMPLPGIYDEAAVSKAFTPHREMREPKDWARTFPSHPATLKGWCNGQRPTGLTG